MPSLKQIGSELHINSETVKQVVKRYKMLGGMLYIDPMNLKNKQAIKNPHTTTRPKKLSKEQLEFIMDPKTLRDWLSFSLNKRCALIKDKFQIELSRVTLAKYYKKHQVNYIVPGYTIHTEQKEEDIHQTRKLFVH